MREIDLTKVSLDPKGLAWLFVGIVVLLLVIGVAAWATGSLKGIFAAKAAPATSSSW